MSKYRVFIGMWEDDGDHDYVHTDVKSLPWDQARDLLAKHLRGFKDDECPVCKAQAKEELDRLMAAEPGPFEGEVEGYDYLITEAS